MHQTQPHRPQKPGPMEREMEGTYIPADGIGQEQIPLWGWEGGGWWDDFYVEVRKTEVFGSGQKRARQKDLPVFLLMIDHTTTELYMEEMSKKLRKMAPWWRQWWWPINAYHNIMIW